MTRTTSRLGFAGVALVLTVSLGGCFPFPSSGGGTPEPEPTASSTVEAGVGIPIRVEQANGVGELTIHGATWNEDAPGNLPFVSENGGGYLIIDATWRTLEGTSTIIANFTMVEDPAGNTGEYFLFVERTFAEVDLPEGESVSGDIGFDIGPGPYQFIVYDEGIREIARFELVAEPRESDGVG